MGFFKFIGRCVGKGIEKLGDVTGIPVLQNIGESIQDACEDVSMYTSQTDSYDKEKARTEETKRINNILTDFSLKLENKSDEIEENVIKESQIYFKQLIDELFKYKKDTGINVKRIQRNMNKIEKKVKGKLKAYISKKVSIDDEECLKVLKMDAGDKKEIAMKKFSERILQEGLSNLADDIKSIIKEQNVVVNEAVQEKLEDIESDLNKKISEFELLENSKKATEEEVNNLKNKLNAKIQLSEACIKVF